MSERIDLHNKNLNFHIVGIFGIGMSGLAQFLKWEGFNVSGSDRALEYPENAELRKSLTAFGIALYKQDGSYTDDIKPDYLVYSTAVEEGNPDFVAAAETPRLHRTELLVEMFSAFNNKQTIAVAGTCGKTSVSSMLAETFVNAGLDPFALVGGFVNSFIDGGLPGNFRAGKGEWAIFESDESDKSLLRFSPDYAILLNLGTDHYTKAELKIIFEDFLRNTKKGVVIEKKLYEMFDPESYKHLDIVVYSEEESTVASDNILHYMNYIPGGNGGTADFVDEGIIKHFRMPVAGRYNAANFLSVLGLYKLLSSELNISEDKYIEAMSRFKGVHRRFEYFGKTSAGTPVYCDFAHNADKIKSALDCAKELTDGRVFAVFQPHGFKPLRVMRGELFDAVNDSLSVDDRFILLPVYYVGGTCNADPKAEDVIAEYSEKSSEPAKFMFSDTRIKAAGILKNELKSNDILLIMGARDNSLPVWTAELRDNL